MTLERVAVGLLGGAGVLLAQKSWFHAVLMLVLGLGLAFIAEMIKKTE